MSCLLDTPTLLWWFFGDPRLSKSALQALEETRRLCWSPVNLWEIGVKMGGSGYSDFRVPERWDLLLTEMFVRFAVTELPIRPAHCRRIQDLPFHHKDPFDRMLVAQAQEEQLTIISSDEVFDAYGVKRIW
ncbi:type II toxin-antitoxin system VapC family toxin [Luteolibacter arcticus]|uniref:Type II toxin-antitoxin system VapC family toxin n=1 Tax=Luteolibacter arcticus TaxID=1581411 RepID=A0ABT3GNA0_9BACT|nr:type II toxin-antitoxin system VapC family toxin [Luteolibacter arcticus]MCW1924987.1 type II toxin-antitoxin system VapC family toxin [Luteolibacter arcticus]